MFTAQTTFQRKGRGVENKQWGSTLGYEEGSAPFTLQEMKRAIDKSGVTSPGKEKMLYHIETSRRYWVRQDSESV